MWSRSVCCFVTICRVAVALLFINADGGLFSVISFGIFNNVCTLLFVVMRSVTIVWFICLYMVTIHDKLFQS